jgi:hypothetical protein
MGVRHRRFAGRFSDVVGQIELSLFCGEMLNR